jgi:hypothetical protein
MAPRLAAKGNQSGGESRSVVSDVDAKEVLAKIAALQAKLLQRSEHVGPRFANEARAMHLGDIEARPIHGRATRAEAERLMDEGVPVAPLPLPVPDPGEAN